jgi:hypothetical protein
MAVTGQKTVAAAWRSLVTPSDHVGIKISAGGGEDFSSHQPIIDAVLKGLSEAGIPMSQVVIWDRADPLQAGYQVSPGGPAIRHIEPITGYDPKSMANMPVVGELIWGDADYQQHGPGPLQPSARPQYSSESHWSRLICGLTKIINIPVMSSAEECGVAGCIYNVTIPNLDNWRRFLSEPGNGDPFLPELYTDRHSGAKVVINIMDGLIAQFGGGPDWDPNYSWAYSRIYASKDPVAIDATALRLMDGWRKQAKLPPLTRRAGYLRTAAAMGLGAYNEDQIELVEEGK